MTVTSPALVREGVGRAVHNLWVVTVHAVLAWLALGMTTLTIIHTAPVPVARHLWRRTHPGVRLYGS